MIQGKSGNFNPSDRATDLSPSSETGDSKNCHADERDTSSPAKPNLFQVHKSILESDEIAWIKLAQGELSPWLNPVQPDIVTVTQKDGTSITFNFDDPDTDTDAIIADKIRYAEKTGISRDPIARARNIHEKRWEWAFIEESYILASQGDSAFLGFRFDGTQPEREKWRQHIATYMGGIPERPLRNAPLCFLESTGDATCIEDLTPFAPRDLARPDFHDVIESAYTGEKLDAEELLIRVTDSSSVPVISCSALWLVAMLHDCGVSEESAIEFLNGSLVRIDERISQYRYGVESLKRDREIVLVTLDLISRGYGRSHRPGGTETLRCRLVHGGDRENAIRSLANSGSQEIQAYNFRFCEPLLAEHEIRSIISKRQRSSGRTPEVWLPGGSVPVILAAKQLGVLLNETDRYFSRGGTPVRVTQSDKGDYSLQVLKPAHFPSIFEEVAKLFTVSKKGAITPATCNKATAELIVNAEAFLGALSPIHVVSPCPVLVERDGKLKQVVGYDLESGVLAAGEPLPEITLCEAVNILYKVVNDFRFSAFSDQSRAMAAIITPAMVHGGLLNGRAPLDLGEADLSQTGKGFRNKCTASIYRQSVGVVTQKKNGVGSLEEEFNTRLVRGENFICLDNIRGELNSPALESFLTEDSYPARVPHQASVNIDPRRYVVMLTANKAELTEDMANRSSCVRILKQPENYRFAQYPEGGILDHIRANQSRFLAAVFAIIREWHRQGKPKTNESRHDFREWAQNLDWIVQNILDCAPLIDGHKETKARMTNPHLSWLRDVAIAIDKEEVAGTWLRSSAIVDAIDPYGVEIPGLKDGESLENDATREKIFRAMGTRLSRCFGAKNELVTGLLHSFIRRWKNRRFRV